MNILFFLRKNSLDKGWQFIESKDNNIIINKKYSELEEINIMINDNT